MFWLTSSRVVNFALQNFWRNIWLSVVTVTIVSLSLLSISGLGLLSALSSEALNRLEERIDIAVYLKPELKADDLSTAQTMAESIPGVKTVSLTTADKALSAFRAKHQDNPLIAQALIELGGNPLGASLTIRALTEKDYPSILKSLQGEQFARYIQEAHFDDYRQVMENVNQLSDRLATVAKFVSGFFLLITLLVVFNAIRMNIYTHRGEISIMRLVGASSWFIRAPFWIEGALYAALGTLLTAGIFWIMLVVLQPYVNGFFGDTRFSLVGYFNARAWWFFGSQFLGATVLSILASTIAMRKYLKV